MAPGSRPGESRGSTGSRVASAPNGGRERRRGGAASARPAGGGRPPAPPMDESLHDEALARGLIRYCPICDGFEVTDKKVGGIGSGGNGVAEAVFLRGF